MEQQKIKPEELDDSRDKALKTVKRWLKPFYSDNESLENAIFWQERIREYQNPNYNPNSDGMGWGSDYREWIEEYQGRTIDFLILTEAYEYHFQVWLKPELYKSHMSGVGTSRVSPLGSGELKVVNFKYGPFNLKTWNDYKKEILHNEIYGRISDTWKKRKKR